MEQQNKYWRGNDDRPPLDHTCASQLIGKHLLIGMTYEDHEGNFIEQKQFHGTVNRVNENEGIVVILHGSTEEYKLPPDIRSLNPAPPGEYKLRSTGEVVINPDFMTTWVLKKPKT